MLRESPWWRLARRMRARPAVPDDPRQTLGRQGEDRACEELRRRGYDILARRYRTRYGEIDIVACEGGTIVFVEVKARRGGAFGPASAAVTPWKQRRVARMAADYLARHGLADVPARFDVVAIDYDDRDPRIDIFTHAFTT